MNSLGRKLTPVVITLIAALAGAAPAAASFGFAGFDGEVSNQDGSAAVQAGGHPFQITTTFSLNRRSDPVKGEVGDGDVRRLRVDLPPGFVGNPQAAPTCGRLLFSQTVVTGRNCPPDTQVGTVGVTFSVSGSVVGPVPGAPRTPLYRLAPDGVHPASFGFFVVTVPVILDGRVRPDDYGITVEAPEISQVFPVLGTEVTFWGTPADPAHSAERACGNSYEFGCPSNAPLVPLLTNPTSCTAEGVGLETRATASAWQGGSDSASFLSHLPAPQQDTQAGTNGCNRVPFGGSASIQVTSSEAGSPTGLDVRISTPQSEDIEGLATAHLKRAQVTLPDGMAVNPSSANGLAACSNAQIGLGNSNSANCPAASRIGSVSVATPLLEDRLQGSVFLAKQGENKFGKLLVLYMVVEGEGVVLKLAGKVEPDPTTGRLVATFDDNPQLPFDTLEVHIKSGPRAPLITPAACGTYAATVELTPWSGTPPLTSTSDFNLTSGPNGAPCPNGAFNPKLEAGTINPAGGKFSPFLLRLSREDATQRLSSLKVTLPKGLTGKLAGVPYCPEAALGTISSAEGTGAAQVASPSCPAASQVGRVSAAAGAGSSPFHVDTGKAYLAGPYKGAPLSLAIVTPALAGPFDLGSVVVRSALQINPATAQITAESDPIPTILHGIPLDLRHVSVLIDRPGFTLNPTNCSELAFSGSATSPWGAMAPLSDRFQATDCASLGFAPKLKLSIQGGHKRGAYQKLKAVLTQPRNQANIGKVSVALPHSQFLAQEHIKTICTRVQYAADVCPAGSIYGKAKAWTPLLDRPLEGPVYLRSSNNPLPDLVAALHGQIDIDLAGKIDSVNGGIRSTFNVVPDAPVTKFVLEMKGGKKSLLVNSRNICKSISKATVKIDAQNGRTADQNPALSSTCKKGNRSFSRAPHKSG